MEQEPNALLKKMLDGSSEKSKPKPRILVYKRDADGKRILKPKIVPRKKYKKRKPKVLNCSSLANYSGGDREQEVSDCCIETSDFEVSATQKSIVSDCVSLLTSLTTAASKRKKRSWHERVQSNLNQWSQSKELIRNTLLMKSAIHGKCQHCKVLKGIILCNSCIPHVFCGSCDKNIHSQKPFHDRVYFYNNVLRHLTPLETANVDGCIEDVVRYPMFHDMNNNLCSCGNEFECKQSEELCAIITLRGRFDLYKYQLYRENCETYSYPFTLENSLIYGFWPGLPSRSSWFVDEKVFEMWDTFRKNMPGSSEKSFLQSLSDISMANGRNGTISSQLFSISFKQYNYWNYDKDVLRGNDWLKCPCCSVYQHSCHVDGNAKLYRYKSSGRRKGPSYYIDGFFYSNSAIESYLTELYKNKSQYKDHQNNICGGTWKAARNAKSKFKSLDETGLEVASCRHRIAQKALNMFQGELFGYPLFMMKHFMKENKVEFCFSDVICKLWKFATENEKELENCMKPALSVMHAKGHDLSCQVLWSGEWIPGTGKSTGEETEQVFSFLSRCSNTTKYQTPENREETITEMALFWNRRKIINLFTDLRDRYNKNEKNILQVENQVSEMQKQFPNLDLSNLVNRWIDEFKNLARGISVFKRQRKLRNDEKILLLIHNLREKTFDIPYKEEVRKLSFPLLIDMKNIYRLLEFEESDKIREMKRLLQNCNGAFSMESAYESLKEQIWKPMYQNEIEKRSMEKLTWAVMLQKQADSSKARHACRAKMTVVVKSLKELLNEYVKIYNMTESFDDYDLDKGIFPWNKSIESGLYAVDRRLCCEYYQKKYRLLEERNLIQRDFESAMKFYHDQVLKLDEEVRKLKSFVDDAEAKVLSADSVEEGVHERDPTVISVAKLQEKVIALQFSQQQVELALNTYHEIFKKKNPIPSHGHEKDDENDSNVTTDDNLTDDEEFEIEQRDTDVSPGIVFDIELVFSVGKDLSNLYESQLYEENQDAYQVCWFPETCCQGKLNGINGSNACVVICLLIGYVLSFGNVLPDNKDLLIIMCGCIDIGNMKYKSKFDGEFLTVFLGIGALPRDNMVCLSKEDNIMIEEDMSHIDLEIMLSSTESNCFRVIIVNGKAYCLFMIGHDCVLVDTHQNDKYGGKVFRFKLEDISFSKIVSILQFPLGELCYIGTVNRCD